jgi:2'-5' RNA ligase
MIATVWDEIGAKGQVWVDPDGAAQMDEAIGPLLASLDTKGLTVEDGEEFIASLPDALANTSRVWVTLDESLTAAAVDFTSGSMIALYPQLHEAEALALHGGQPAADLHLTLAFLPEGVTVDLEELTISLGTLAGMTGYLEGEVGGTGEFKEGPEGKPFIALPDIPGLNEFRADVVALLDLMEQEYATNHGFQPHVTLGYDMYVGEDDGMELEGIPLTFTALSLVMGAERVDYPFLETQVSEEVEA